MDVKGKNLVVEIGNVGHKSIVDFGSDFVDVDLGGCMWDVVGEYNYEKKDQVVKIEGQRKEKK